ncbi:hypothetical protein BGW36DRAFT_387786 [Talaromyces proteolyticus]|uniref:Uncharacterized protein n=1 Tax=Talaromyces proteolyticus TaxID=1131652 RepID=A0AAD4KFI4_9EURO|nr:uncharacterized protein BGW36DRAFT_387786 [Talaromyces proteolyticus]KAH8691153.1 hypothetical protein BGW36DRAFT_387786 [Talaromyces proteolyticus]
MVRGALGALVCTHGFDRCSSAVNDQGERSRVNNSFSVCDRSVVVQLDLFATGSARLDSLVLGPFWLSLGRRLGGCLDGRSSLVTCLDTYLVGVACLAWLGGGRDILRHTVRQCGDGRLRRGRDNGRFDAALRRIIRVLAWNTGRIWFRRGRWRGF